MSIAMIRKALKGSGVITAWSGLILDVKIDPADASGGITVANSGAITGLRAGGATAWYSPTGGTPGNSYYVKFTKVGDAWDAGLTEGTVYALSSSRSVVWSQTIVGAKTGVLTVSIYTDSGGTDLVGVGTVDYDVSVEP